MALGHHPKPGKKKEMRNDSANWVIKEKTNTGFQGEPLGMVIAYVDDLIAVGQQDQLDGMKASLDAVYHENFWNNSSTISGRS